MKAASPRFSHDRQALEERNHQGRRAISFAAPSRRACEEVVTGAIAEDDQQLTKFHGTYLQDDRDVRGERTKKKLEKAFSFMIRVRLPGGLVTPAQWLALDRIADDYANGTLAADHAPDLPVPRRDQDQHEADHAGDQRRACWIRSRPAAT